MSFIRSLWNWALIALLGVAAFAVVFGAPIEAVIGDSQQAWLSTLGAIWIAISVGGAMVSSALGSKGKGNKPLERFSSVANLLLLLGVLGSLARAVLGIAPRGGETAFAHWLDAALGPAWGVVASAGDRVGMPTDLAGIPSAPLTLLLMLFLSRNAISWRLDKMRRGKLRGDASLPADPRAQREGSEEARERAKAVERRLAVASYSEAKTLLQASHQELTFVSLDIVGSTVLKQGEDPYLVEQSFGDYRKLVERALRHYGACKQVWTPDGQMAAFRNPQAGVECAKEVLLQLEDFNRERSRLKRPFRIRAGANIGSVSTDDRTPMEEISDFSIDIAGHMQKYADPDTLWISEDLYRRLDDSSGFGANGKEVDGRQVFAWTKAD